MYRLVTLLLLLILCKQCKTKHPSRNWYNKGSDGLYYKFHNENSDWDSAKTKCEGESAHLAIIISSSTFQYIKDTYSFHMGGIWIGARDMNSSGDWRWTTQTPVENTYWEDGEPGNNSVIQEDCVMINFAKNPGRFHDASCRWMEPKFLCQKEHRSCVKEEGYCVTQDGKDVNTINLGKIEGDKCLEKCLAHTNATACSVVKGHPVKKEDGCYATTQLVKKGNGEKRHTCWIISKCEGTGPLAPHPPEIPSGYIKGYRKSSFKLYMHEVDFNTAKLKCHEDGAQPAIVESAAMHDFLLQTFPGQTYWIGVNSLEQRGVWKYEDGRRVEKQKFFWDGGRPRPHKEDKRCVLTWHNGKWRDESCTGKRPFLCEIQSIFVRHTIEHGDPTYILPLIIVGAAVLLIGVALGVFLYHRKRRQQAESSSIPPPENEGGIPNEGLDNLSVEGIPNGPLKPVDVYGVAVDPSNYDDMYPGNAQYDAPSRARAPGEHYSVPEEQDDHHRVTFHPSDEVRYNTSDEVPYNPSDEVTYHPSDEERRSPEDPTNERKTSQS